MACTEWANYSIKWAWRRRRKIGRRLRLMEGYEGIPATAWRVYILRSYRSKRHPMSAVGVIDVANRRPDRCWRVTGQVPF